MLSITVACLLFSPALSPGLEQLTVKGTQIVSPAGEPVPLRGVNFGGWLMLETWISGIEREWDDRLREMADETGVRPELDAAFKALGKWDDDTEPILDHIGRLHQALRDNAKDKPGPLAAYFALYDAEPPVFAAHDFDRVLRERFGDGGAQQVWDLYHDTWLTERDFQLAAALGFTFVRLPFWYRWFEDDDRPGEYRDYGFKYLDRAVEWAAKHRLYLMPDFHGAPGGQSPWDHTGELSRNEFFTCDACLRRTAALWEAIAARYRDNPAVFAYDTLNEPFSAKDLDDWVRVQDTLYRTIRRGDPDGIVVMEDGYKLESMPWMMTGFFPKPEEHGWENVVYSFHFYSGGGHEKRAAQVARIARREQDRCGAPLYAGEFSTMSGTPEGLEGMRVYCSLFNREGWMWSPWTFKYVDGEGKGAMWGVYRHDGPWRTPNIHRDSLEDILAAIRRMDTANFTLHPGYGNVLRECLTQPWAPPPGQNARKP